MNTCRRGQWRTIASYGLIVLAGIVIAFGVAESGDVNDLLLPSFLTITAVALVFLATIVRYKYRAMRYSLILLSGALFVMFMALSFVFTTLLEVIIMSVFSVGIISGFLFMVSSRWPSELH